MKWYYKSWVIFLAILFFGPLGLILLWFRPDTKLSVKIIVSVLVIAFSAWMVYGSVTVYSKLMDYYETLGELV